MTQRIKQKKTPLRTQKTPAKKTRVSKRVKIEPVKQVSRTINRRKVKNFRFPTWCRFIPFLLGAVFILLLLNLLLRFLFSVETITCTINEKEDCPSVLTNKLQSVKGKSLFFTNFAGLIDNMQSPSLSFTTFSYQKKLPHQLYIDFTLLPASYVVVSQNEPYYINNQAGFTLPSEADLLYIEDKEHKLSVTLVNYNLDTFFHQKIIELMAFSTEDRLDIKKIDYYDLEQVVIPLSSNTYIIDFTNLDENLQKLAFIEHNHRNDTTQIIDLRFRLPVIKTSLDLEVANDVEQSINESTASAVVEEINVDQLPS